MLHDPYSWRKRPREDNGEKKGNQGKSTSNKKTQVGLQETSKNPDQEHLQPNFEGIEHAPEEKAAEKLIKVTICPTTLFFFLLGETIEAKERKELIDFLKENEDVFAWSPHEQPWINPIIAYHELQMKTDYNVKDEKVWP